MVRTAHVRRQIDFLALVHCAQLLFGLIKHLVQLLWLQRRIQIVAVDNPLRQCLIHRCTRIVWCTKGLANLIVSIGQPVRQYRYGLVYRQCLVQQCCIDGTIAIRVKIVAVKIFRGKAKRIEHRGLFLVGSGRRHQRRNWRNQLIRYQSAARKLHAPRHLTEEGFTGEHIVATVNPDDDIFINN